MARRSPSIALLLSTVALSGCASLFEPQDCAGVGHPAPVNVAIRDIHGNPVALGSVVTFITANTHTADSTTYDSLDVTGGDEGAAYDIQVVKRYYATDTVRGVHVPSGGFCDYDYSSNGLPITVPVTLTLAPGAPAFRSLNLLPTDVLLDRGGPRTNFTFAAVFDADPGVSRAVRWRIVGDTASVTLDSVSGYLTYRCQQKSGQLTLTATAVADSTMTASASVRTQGHPAPDQSDPPCS